VAAIAGAQAAGDLHEDLARHFNRTCVDLRALADRPLEVHRGFVDAMHIYFAELAANAFHARAQGVTPAEIAARIVADGGRPVDISFKLADGSVVRITGANALTMYDWRTGRHRILDFKQARGAD